MNKLPVSEQITDYGMNRLPVSVVSGIEKDTKSGIDGSFV